MLEYFIERVLPAALGAAIGGLLVLIIKDSVLRCLGRVRTFSAHALKAPWCLFRCVVNSAVDARFRRIESLLKLPPLGPLCRSRRGPLPPTQPGPAPSGLTAQQGFAPEQSKEVGNA